MGGVWGDIVDKGRMGGGGIMYRGEEIEEGMRNLFNRCTEGGGDGGLGAGGKAGIGGVG